MKFDSFDPFVPLKMYDFQFNPTRYEIWQSAKLVGSGPANYPIRWSVIEEDEKRIQAVIMEESLKSELCARTIYDAFYSLNDRLQMITVPSETNISCAGLEAGKMIIGATRKEKMFASNEAFCCNLFFKRQAIKKVSFALSNPARLIEFYQEDEKIDMSQVNSAICLIRLLLDDHDSDGAIVEQKKLIEQIENDFGVVPTDEDLIQALALINSCFPENNDIVRLDFSMGGIGMYYISRYSKNSLSKVLKEIELMI